MRLLSRYLLRELTAPFVFALGALTSMLLLNHVAKRFGDLVGKGLPVGVIVEVLLLSLPFIVALTLPMAILVAVLYGISQLAAANEVTAMRANGIGVAQLLRPVLLAGVGLALFNFVFIDQVLPRTNARLKNLMVDISRKKPTAKFHEQAVNELPPTQYLLQAAGIEGFSGRMRDVVIYDLSLPAARRIIYAEAGLMAFEPNGRDLQLRLFRGEAHEYRPAENGVVRVTTFAENTIRARDVSNVLELGASDFERGDREMSTCEMIDRAVVARGVAARARQAGERYTRRDLRAVLRLAAQPEAPLPEIAERRHCGPWRGVERFLGRFIFPPPAEAQGVPGADATRFRGGPATRLAQVPAPGVPAQLSTVAELSVERDRQRSEIQSAHRFQVEIHKKFTISVACLNFVLIGIALALRFPRGGMGLVLGGSLVIFAFFYITMTAGESLADRSLVTPALAMWFPNVLLGIAGVGGLLLVSRATGSTRGGDLADLRQMLFGWLRRRAA